MMTNNNNNNFLYSKIPEDVIKKVTTVLNKYSNKPNNRFYAIKLLENNIELNEKIRRQFIAGISEYADRSKDGRECLAEACVRYRNGEWIPDEARKLIRKYILHWRRV